MTQAPQGPAGGEDRVGGQERVLLSFLSCLELGHERGLVGVSLEVVEQPLLVDLLLAGHFNAEQTRSRAAQLDLERPQQIVGQRSFRNGDGEHRRLAGFAHQQAVPHLEPTNLVQRRPAVHRSFGPLRRQRGFAVEAPFEKRKLDLHVGTVGDARRSEAGHQRDRGRTLHFAGAAGEKDKRAAQNPQRQGTRIYGGKHRDLRRTPSEPPSPGAS